MTNVKVLSCDIATVKADTIITAACSNVEKYWYSDIDCAIRYSSRSWMFHLQLLRDKPLVDGQLVFAQPRGVHEGPFNNVLFIVDDLGLPLYDLVLSALQEAERLQLPSVSIPLIRTGKTKRISETREAAVESLANAIADFAAGEPVNVEVINIVVDNNFNDVKNLRDILGL